MSQFNIKLNIFKQTINTFNQEINDKIRKLETLLGDLDLSSPSEEAVTAKVNYDWTIDSEGALVIATDGSAKMIDGVSRASYAVAYGPIGHPLNLACPIYGVATIFFAEVKAVTRALQEACLHGHTRLNIVIDSESAKNFLQEVFLYANESSLVKVLTSEHPEMQGLVTDLCSAKEKYQSIQFTKIRSHTGQKGHLYEMNDAADQLAQQVLDATFAGFTVPTRVSNVSY